MAYPTIRTTDTANPFATAAATPSDTITLIYTGTWQGTEADILTIDIGGPSMEGVTVTLNSNFSIGSIIDTQLRPFTTAEYSVMPLSGEEAASGGCAPAA